MKQAKKKSQKLNKKQPINVQLTKDDLAELLIVVKDFIVEELQGNIREQVLAEFSRQGKRLFLNSSENAKRMDCHNQRILRLEKLTNDQRIKRISYCSHDDKLKSLVYLETTGTFLVLKYKCEICGREYDKPYWLLSYKEKKALRKLGVNIK